MKFSIDIENILTKPIDHYYIVEAKNFSKDEYESIIKYICSNSSNDIHYGGQTKFGTIIDHSSILSYIDTIDLFIFGPRNDGCMYLVKELIPKSEEELRVMTNNEISVICIANSDEYGSDVESVPCSDDSEEITDEFY